MIRESQREGIALAKQRGVYRGRQKSLRSDQVEELRNRVQADEKKAQLARLFGISCISICGNTRKGCVNLRISVPQQRGVSRVHNSLPPKRRAIMDMRMLYRQPPRTGGEWLCT